MPVIPQKEAGCLIEPPVSVPVAKAHKFAFTAAAEPPEDPPGLLRGLIGFLTFPKKLVSFEEPIANSSILVFPSIIVLEFSNFSNTVEE